MSVPDIRSAYASYADWIHRFEWADRLVVDTLAALTRFRVELGHLEAPLKLCERCTPGGLATYWTPDLEEHPVFD